MYICGRGMKQKKLLSFAAFIKNFLKSVGQVLLATIILFIFLELIFRVLGFPSGADDFVEGVVMKTKLPFRKAKGEMRVFAYGESTLVGAPYDEVSGPIRWLEKYLKEFLPDQDVRIVNFARMGRVSNFTYQTFRDTLAYQPDIAIFYMGHNEFLQDERKDEIPFEDSNTAYLFRSTVQQSRFISAVYREFVKKRKNSKTGWGEKRLKIKSVTGERHGHCFTRIYSIAKISIFSAETYQK